MRTHTIVMVVVLVLVVVAVLPPVLGQSAAPEVLEAAQSVVILSPVADAAVDSTEPDGNQGSSSTLNVYWSGQSEEGYALLRFNLAAAVPSEAVIDSAVLELYVQSSSGADPVTLTASRVITDWVESTVTWNTRPITGSPTTTASVGGATGYQALDVTTIVQAWHNVPHYGLELSGPASAFGRSFGSREYGDHPPRLTVTYHVPALEFAPIGDATVDSDFPGVNMGNEPILDVGWDTAETEHIRRALLRFPPLELPEHAVIEEAWLELARQDGEDGVVARITDDWSEDGVTWENQPGYDRPIATPEEGSTTRWDVTALVDGWQSGIFPNYGLALLEAAGTAGSATYASREGAPAPRLLVSYTMVGNPDDPLEPQMPPGLGPPTFLVDAGLVPFDDTLAPIIVGGEPITRPLAVLQAEYDSPYTFIADEVLFTPASPAELETFLSIYDGRVLREPGLPELPPGFDVETRDVAPDPSYLVQVDPMLMNLDSLESDASALGLKGEMRVSSDEGLHLLALVLYEQNNNSAIVSLNGAGQFVQSFPPLTLQEEPFGIGGFENPIGEAWRYPEMGDTTTQMTGVNRAWQYMAFSTRAVTGVQVAIIDGGFCLDSSGNRCTDASARTNIDLPANFMQYDFDGDDYNASGTNPTSCTGGSPCPYHGSGTTSIATAAQNNGYGIAGVGSPVARPMLFKVDVGLGECARAIRTATKWGARVTSMSWTIDCGWWCTSFPGISGYSTFKNAMIEADNAGVFTVSAAGNNNSDLGDEFLVPCALRWNSLCVGALANNSRARASFSNWGTKSAIATGTGGVNIWAPGESVRIGPDLAATGNHDINGTSIATPFVAGAASLAWGVNPNLTHKQIRGLILNTRHAPLNSEVAPGSINVKDLVLRAGPPLEDHLGDIGSVESAALITATGHTDLTIEPGEVDYFEYQATDYVSAQFTATYVEPLGDLYMGGAKSSMVASQGKITGTNTSTYSIVSNDLCIGNQYGEEFTFYVKGTNPAVGNAYSVTVQTTPSGSLNGDKNEPNDTVIMATPITVPQMSSMDFFTADRIDCRNGLTLHSLGDTDFYTFTIASGTVSVTQHYTAVCAGISADFPITVTLLQGDYSNVLKTEYGRNVSLRYGPVQPGESYQLHVKGATLNAYTMRVRVCDPRGDERAYWLEDWLKAATLPQPPKVIPDPEDLLGLPPWLRGFPWDSSTLFALEANHVTPVADDLGVSNMTLEGDAPRVFALGSAMGGTLNLMVGPGVLGDRLVEAEGVYALLQDADGNELWRVEGVQDIVEWSGEIEGGWTYLLLVNGLSGTQANLTVDLPDSSVYLPLVLRDE